uniref:Zinc finger CCCH domain-containing protein 3 n=1 Tax=Cynoglossus semilaevis TaxID=244447 RepID=A0A3P8UNM3_CYNSE
MEEREALKRQIELLQDLINKHKSVHGDVPSTTEQRHQHVPPSARGHRGHSRSLVHPYTSRGGLYSHESRGCWRKTHSLRNKGPQSTVGHHSSTSSPTAQSSAPPVPPASSSISAPSCSKEPETDRTKAAASSTTGVPEPNSTLLSSTLGKGTKLPSTIPSQASVTKSKFTWVKSQDMGGEESKKSSVISPPANKTVKVSPTPATKTAAASGGSPTVFKRASAKKLPRKLSPVTVDPKASKYKWVSAKAKVPRKPLSPKTLTLQRTPEMVEVTKRIRTPTSSSAKIKRTSISTPSSRYRWKAAGQITAAGATARATGTQRKSAFHWTADKSHKGGRGTASSSTSSASSPAGFKLRSRMKIIRKSAKSGGGSERGSSPSAGKSLPRGQMHFSPRTHTGIRRTPSRELVSFNRHKLRRVPHPSSSRTSSTYSYHRVPAGQQVFRTRYKMVTRPGSSATHHLHYNPTLSWRAKRIQSARSFLQSRLRSTQHRHPSSTQCWRGSSMCWIRGSLYRVSANKLSRTVTANISINRKGHPSSPNTLSMTTAWNRTSSTRYMASRAGQRSLAIIRHARQKKQQKQFCMYYNRFGKCNRGDRCPYIHDPDKVAVCTRFLRGTCKKADGTCPFSHKVAKEKMPVCSFFLKGICNNSECPYSHVYVSRKAEVCEDFVKGYCPQGEKCKKKHTLVCPEFSKTGSCPKGSRCKLKHRQKRSTSNTSGPPVKKVRAKESTESLQTFPETSTPGPLSLPSFISLCSSPEDPDTPDTPPAETSQVKGNTVLNQPGTNYCNNVYSLTSFRLYYTVDLCFIR